MADLDIEMPVAFVHQVVCFAVWIDFCTYSRCYTCVYMGACSDLEITKYWIPLFSLGFESASCLAVKGESDISPQIINFLPLAIHILPYYFCLDSSHKYSALHTKHMLKISLMIKHDYVLSE